MLSEYERRVLGEIESSLRLVRPETLLRRSARAARLPAAGAAFLAVFSLTCAAVVTGAAAAVLVGVFGVVLGWQLSRAARGLGRYVRRWRMHRWSHFRTHP